MKRWTGRWLNCVFAAVVWFCATTVFAERYGLMVGIDQYDPAYGASPLNSCINDAEGFRARLLADGQRWSAANITTLLDAAATREAIRARLALLAATAVPGDVVVYFHSSHGGTHGGTAAYLCAYNANYEDHELGADLTAFADGVSVIIVIDACYSGGLFKNASGTVEWNFAQHVMEHVQAANRVSGLAKGASIGWMTACDYNEVCWAGSPYSVFAGFLIDAFTFGDANADGVLSFRELYDYAEPRALTVNPSQHAQILNGPLLSALAAAAAAQTPELAEALNCYLIDWTCGGDQDWIGCTEVSKDGQASARSGRIGDNERSTLGGVVRGPGQLSFWWKVSSEAGYDFLRFAINGVTQPGSLSGEVDWQQRTYTLPEGLHALQWSYEKDYMVSAGRDCGWVDRVEWMPVRKSVYPAGFGGWVAVGVWDSVEARWVVCEEHLAPAEIVVPHGELNRWYWFGVWDYAANRWAAAEWLCRFE